jgi:PBSX family phage terminase large subunit
MDNLSTGIKEMSANNIYIPSVYKEIFLDNYRYFILSSGRIAGKTSILKCIWWATINKYPDRDIVILQATATEIKNSMFNEIKKFVAESDLSNEFIFPKNASKITWLGHTGETYFFPITDSKGGQRTRGISTENKISLVLYEEAQKNKDANVLEQSVATFVRQLDKEAKLIIVGNSETVGHWFVDYVQKKREDKSWYYIYACCYDIWGLLNEQTKQYIENFRITNPIEFRRMFLGDIKASTSNVVFPQFSRENNYKTIDQMEKHYIYTLIIGIDHATSNDTFAVVPVAILDDGTTQTLEVMYDDPEETQRTLAPTEQCDMLSNFIDFLDNKYGIEYNQLKTILSVDGAATPFIKQLEHTKKTATNKNLWKFIKVKGFTKKHKDINLGIIKNAFAYGVLTILNEGPYKFDGTPNKHRLASEIEKQRYGANGKLDPKIKNDLCDALEYGLIPYYINCYNLSFPMRYKKSHYDDIVNAMKVQKGEKIYETKTNI